jgi:hypothetical protein
MAFIPNTDQKKRWVLLIYAGKRKTHISASWQSNEDHYLNSFLNVLLHTSVNFS